MRMLICNTSQVFLLFALLAIVTRIEPFPQSRDLKEDTVGETMHVDRDDGEAWYPVDGGGSDEGPAPPEMSSKQNHLANDLLDAVRNIFLKWDYTLDQIPRPFGNGDPWVPFHSTPEFTNVLKLLIEKLPAELDLPILNILKDNGVYELNVPTGTLDNSAELRRIDEIIAQIQALSGNSRYGGGAAERQPSHEVRIPEEDTEVDGKYDAARDATTYCGTESGNCPSKVETATTAHTMDHPKIDTPPGKLLVEHPETPAEDAAKLRVDEGKLETLIREVKETLTGAAAEVKPLEPDDGAKMVEDMSQISNLVAEVESIAERNVKLLGESPCEPNASPKGDHDLSKLDAMMREIETFKAGNKASIPARQNDHVDLEEIDRMIKEMKALTTAGASTDGGHQQSKPNQITMDEVNQILAQIQQHQLRQQTPASEPDGRLEKSKALDEIIREIQTFQSMPQAHGMGHFGTGDADFKQIDDLINDIRRYESDFHPEHQHGAGRRAEDATAIDALIADIQKHQSALSHEAAPDNQNDVKRNDDAMTAIDALINAVKARDVDQMISEMETQKLGQAHKTKLDAMDELIDGIQHQKNPFSSSASDGGDTKKYQQIDSLVTEMKNAQSKQLHTHANGGGPDLRKLEATMNEIRNHQAQRQRQNPSSAEFRGRDERLDQIDSMMSEMKNAQSNKMNTRPKGGSPDLGELEATMNEIRNHQAERQFQNPSAEFRGRDERLDLIDSMMSEMKNAQSNKMNTRPKGGGPDIGELEATMDQIRNHQAHAQSQQGGHVPRHGSPEQELRKLDDLVYEIQNVAKLHAPTKINVQVDKDKMESMDAMIDDIRAKYGTSSQGSPPAPSQMHSPDQLQMLEKIIEEIGQIAKQEEKNIEDKSSADKMEDLDAIMKEIHDSKSQAAASGDGKSKSHPRMEEVNRIMNDLEQESSIERDLQRAMDEQVKQSPSVGTRKRMQETDQVMEEIRDFQSRSNRGREDQAKTFGEIQKLIEEMNELKHGGKGEGGLKPNANSHVSGSQEGQLGAGEGFKEDKFNAADESYLRRLQAAKLRKSKARKELRD